MIIYVDGVVSYLGGDVVCLMWCGGSNFIFKGDGCFVIDFVRCFWMSIFVVGDNVDVVFMWDDVN